jgi:hypothetical protein
MSRASKRHTHLGVHSPPCRHQVWSRRLRAGGPRPASGARSRPASAYTAEGYGLLRHVHHRSSWGGASIISIPASGCRYCSIKQKICRVHVAQALLALTDAGACTTAGGGSTGCLHACKHYNGGPYVAAVCSAFQETVGGRSPCRTAPTASGASLPS